MYGGGGDTGQPAVVTHVQAVVEREVHGVVAIVVPNVYVVAVAGPPEGPDGQLLLERLGRAVLDVVRDDPERALRQQKA